jgi:hypothetical protein
MPDMNMRAYSVPLSTDGREAVLSLPVPFDANDLDAIVNFIERCFEPLTYTADEAADVERITAERYHRAHPDQSAKQLRPESLQVETFAIADAPQFGGSGIPSACADTGCTNPPC